MVSFEIEALAVFVVIVCLELCNSAFSELFSQLHKIMIKAKTSKLIIFFKRTLPFRKSHLLEIQRCLLNKHLWVVDDDYQTTRVHTLLATAAVFS